MARYGVSALLRHLEVSGGRLNRQSLQAPYRRKLHLLLPWKQVSPLPRYSQTCLLPQKQSLPLLLLSPSRSSHLIPSSIPLSSKTSPPAYPTKLLPSTAGFPYGRLQVLSPTSGGLLTPTSPCHGSGPSSQVWSFFASSPYPSSSCPCAHSPNSCLTCLR